MHQRLLPLHPDDLDEAQKSVYDDIIHGSRRSRPQLFPLVDDEGRLQGPFDAMLRSPAVGSALQSVGAAVRFQTTFTPRSRELAILAVAAHWDCNFERFSHEAIGRNCGLTDEEMHEVAAERAPGLTDPVERCVFDAVRMLLVQRDLDDRSYGELIGHLGERGVFELTTLVGYYSALAMQLRVFGVEGPPASPIRPTGQGPSDSP